MCERSVRALVMGTMIMTVAAAGCGHGQIAAIPDAMVQLGPDEGLLLVHTKLEIEFERISIGGAWFEAPELGPKLQVFVLPAGEYRWTSFGIKRGAYRLDEDEPSFSFRVVAGQINYPGELVVESTAINRGRFFTRNRTAMVMGDLEQLFPRLNKWYPFAYTGFMQDDFLAFYRSLKPADQQAVPERAPALEAR